MEIIAPEVTEWDQEQYLAVISTDLDEEQRARVVTPPATYPRQEDVLAVHWHPEFVPLDLIAQRFKALYPNAKRSLIIPTQHNELLAWNGYSGVEVDCYSHGFNRKVQLLLHFKTERVEQGADVLKAMLAHTFKYRLSQLFELMDSLTEDAFEGRRQEAAAQTGADESLVAFCQCYAAKLQTLLEENWSDTPPAMIKNKLVRNFFDRLKDRHGEWVVARAQVYLRAVKEIVKKRFSLQHFYRASEVIEEARLLGAGVVIPHPEQFWPILLADYDVDGYEVWNPQSQEYTEFLITVIDRQNRSRGRGSRPILPFMGDDCHMGEKVRAPEDQDQAKASREIGLQPAWEDMAICKNLILSGMSRETILHEYAARLG